MAKSAFARRGSGAVVESQSQWMSLSDLMAGLMMVFLLISVSMMRQATRDVAEVRSIGEDWADQREAIFNALDHEFGNDLGAWEANLERETLSFTFWSPDVLFPRGKASITARYAAILDAFFPRYVKVLSEFRGVIEEVRIEGHTSSEWGAGSSATEAYFANMDLSQRRTQSVLRHAFELTEGGPHADWVQSTVAAVGFSSAKAVHDDDDVEDEQASRRVTFSIHTNDSARMRQILAGR